jgi:hypothetical protein
MQVLRSNIRRRRIFADDFLGEAAVERLLERDAVLDVTAGDETGRDALLADARRNR